MPRLTEFNAAMKRAGIRLVPSHLQSGKAETWVINPNDPMKKYSQPKYWSGYFAVVYEYNLASGGKRAIRCFFKDPDAAMRKRYRELRSFLKRQAAEFTAEFEYHTDGIVVESGKNAPRHAIIDMQFVEGLEIIDHVSELCELGDRAALKQLAENWVQLTGKMRASDLAHGDLAGGNVMVTPNGKLVLIDYDGMYIPSLKGNVPSERGNSHYQHRDSNHKDPAKRRPYDQHMDDFSMLLIYVAILALAEKPTLFKQYVAHKSDGSLDGDNLLFQDVDLANPDQSKVFKGIAQECRDAELLKLLDKLKTSAKGLIRDVPSFESHFDPWVAIRGMIVQHSPDWKAIHAAAANVPQGVAIPPDVKRGCDDAREHVEALEALEKAIESGNADEVRQAYLRKQLLVRWEEAKQTLADAEELIQKDDEAKKRRAAEAAAINALAAAVKADHSRRKFITLWKKHQGLLADHGGFKRWKAEYDEWNPRIEACDDLLRLINTVSWKWDSDTKVAQAWEKLKGFRQHSEAGRYGHQEVGNPPYVGIGELCVKRRKCLMDLRKIDDQGDEPSDREFVRVWNEPVLDEQTLPGPEAKSIRLTASPDAKKLRPRWDTARQNLADIAKLKAVVDKAEDPANKKIREQPILNKVRELPSRFGLSGSYAYALRIRVERAKQRVDSELAFIEAVKRAPPSDLEIDSAWDELRDAWGDSPKRITLRPETQQLVKTSQVRAKRLRRFLPLLDQCPNETDHDEAADRTLLSVWDDTKNGANGKADFLVSDLPEEFCADVVVRRLPERVAGARDRLENLDELRAAITLDDVLRKKLAACREDVFRMKVVLAEIDQDQAGSYQIEKAGSQIRDWYLRKLSKDVREHVKKAGRQAALTRLLIEAVETNRDEKIANAWESLIEAEVDVAAEIHRERGDLACKRLLGLNELRRIHSQQLSENERDDQLLDVWKEYDLADSEDAKGYRSRIDLARQRTTACRKLLAALDREDDFHIRALYEANLELIKDYPPVRARWDEIDQAIKRCKEADKLFKTLEGGDTPEQREQFVERFAISYIERYPARAAPLMPRIRQWVAEELFRAYPFVKDPYYQVPSLNGNPANPELVVHWTWPEVGKITHCIVGAQWDRSMAVPADAQHGTEKRVSRHGFDEADSSASLVMSSDNGRVLHVAIWPVVELRAGTNGGDMIVGPALTFAVDQTKPPKQESREPSQPESHGLLGKLVRRVLKSIES